MTSGPSVAELADGRHTLSVSAVDAAGNVGDASRETSSWTTRRRIPSSPRLRVAAVGGELTTSPRRGRHPRAQPPRSRALTGSCALVDGSCPARGDGRNGRTSTNCRICTPPHRAITGCTSGSRTQRAISERRMPPSRCRSASTRSRQICRSPYRTPRIRSESRSTSTDRHSGLAHGEIEMRAAGSHDLARAEDRSRGLATGRVRRRRAIPERPIRVSGSRRGPSGQRSIHGHARGWSDRVPAPACTHRYAACAWACRREPQQAQRLDSNISAPFGRRVRLSGRLTNADGQPIEAARSRRLNGDPTAPSLPIGLGDD